MNIDPPYRYMWIGLTDAAVEGTYVWNSTGKATAYSYWLGGQPNNANNNEDNTVLDWPEHGRWADVPASFTSVASMCEQTITPTLPSNQGFPICGGSVPSLSPNELFFMQNHGS